jgi:hypothetical protein
MTTGLGFGKEVFDTLCFNHAAAAKWNLPCKTPFDWKDIDANYWGAACGNDDDCENRCSKVPK